MIAALLRFRSMAIFNLVALTALMLAEADGLPLLATCVYWTMPAVYSAWIAGRYVRDWPLIRRVGRFTIGAIDLAMVAFTWVLFVFYPPPFAA